MYEGIVEFIRVTTDDSGETSREVSFGPRLIEVHADSASDARDKIAAQAKKNWRPRKGWGEVMHIRDVRNREPLPRTFYAFRYEYDGDVTARWGTLYYVPGQLYWFDSQKERNRWVKEGKQVGETRKPVRANRLPKEWRADDAIDPAEEEGENSE